MHLPNMYVQRLLSARALMPPPRSLPSNRNQPVPVENIAKSTSSNTSNSCGPSTKSSRFLNGVRSQNSNASSGSDARKPHRKRRPKKKKQVEIFSFLISNSVHSPLNRVQCGKQCLVLGINETIQS